METNLRPLTLGEILDRTAQLYRSHFWLFAGISAVYAGMVLILGLMHIGLQEIFRIENLKNQMIWMNASAAIVEWLFIFLFGGIAVAANNRAVASVHLGETATIRGAYGGIFPKSGRYLWLMTIMAFVLWIPLVLIYCGYIGVLIFYIKPHGGLPTAPGAATVSVNPQAALTLILVTLGFGIILLIGIAYAVFMGLRYSLAVAACVVEDLTARQGLRRSIWLSQGGRGRIFLLGLLVFVIQFGLVAITQMFFVVIAFQQHGQLSAGLRVAQQVVGFLTNTFIGPMYATGLTLFYYDQRVRKEGYDIERMMQAAGLTAHLPDEAHLESVSGLTELGEAAHGETGHAVIDPQPGAST